jgi:hypothetical protein
MSRYHAEFVEQPDGALLRMLGRVAGNGGAVRVCSHEQIWDTASGLISEGKSKKGRMAPDPYVPEKKWKVILRFDTSNTAHLDPKD